MKKIKRWLGGLCCAALLLALLTACGSQTPQQAVSYTHLTLPTIA